MTDLVKSLRQPPPSGPIRLQRFTLMTRLDVATAKLMLTNMRMELLAHLQSPRRQVPVVIHISGQRSLTMTPTATLFNRRIL